MSSVSRTSTRWARRALASRRPIGRMKRSSRPWKVMCCCRAVAASVCYCTLLCGQARFGCSTGKAVLSSWRSAIGGSATGGENHCEICPLAEERWLICSCPGVFFFALWGCRGCWLCVKRYDIDRRGRGVSTPDVGTKLLCPASVPVFLFGSERWGALSKHLYSSFMAWSQTLFAGNCCTPSAYLARAAFPVQGRRAYTNFFS